MDNQEKKLVTEIPKNVDEFIARQMEAATSNPECGTSHYNLGIGFLGKKMYEQALEAFHKALDCSPNLAEAYVQIGGIRLAQGDIDGCLHYNRMAIKSRAAFAIGHGNIGYCLMQKGEVDEAIRYLQKALAYNSSFIQAYTTLASAYFMKGLIDESIAACNKALSLSPDFAVAHNNLALAYLEKEELDKAGFHCQKAQELGFDVAPGLIAEIEKLQGPAE